jgi:hypothetical protein
MAQTEKALEAENSPDASPELSRSFQDEKHISAEGSSLQLPGAAIGTAGKVSSVLTVFVAGVALFSDGYNAQIIGYMQPLFADLYVPSLSEALGCSLTQKLDIQMAYPAQLKPVCPTRT